MMLCGHLGGMALPDWPGRKGGKGRHRLCGIGWQSSRGSVVHSPSNSCKNSSTKAAPDHCGSNCLNATTQEKKRRNWTLAVSPALARDLPRTHESRMNPRDPRHPRDALKTHLPEA